jgi:hypothetical protein
MKNISKQQKYILFILGLLKGHLNKTLKEKKLSIFLTKSLFIDIIMKVSLINIKERAIYLNLEDMEKKKLIEYKNKNLNLTKIGKKIFEDIYKENKSYLNAIGFIENNNLLKYSKKSQTILSLQ